MYPVPGVLTATLTTLSVAVPVAVEVPALKVRVGTAVYPDPAAVIVTPTTSTVLTLKDEPPPADTVGIELYEPAAVTDTLTIVAVVVPVAAVPPLGVLNVTVGKVVVEPAAVTLTLSTSRYAVAAAAPLPNVTVGCDVNPVPAAVTDTLTTSSDAVAAAADESLHPPVQLNVTVGTLV